MAKYNYIISNSLKGGYNLEMYLGDMKVTIENYHVPNGGNDQLKLQEHAKQIFDIFNKG